MTVAIRMIRETDIDSFWACLDSVCRERLWLGSFEGYPIESTRKFVTDMIENDNAQFVAVDGETVVGWIDITPSRLPVSGHVGHLGMGVHRDYRGQGLGKRLILAALEKAKSNGLKRVELEVYRHNTAAIALYERVGFQHEGARMKAAKLDDGYVDLLQMALWFGE